MEAGTDSRSTGDRRALAPRRLQALLDMALAAPSSRGQKVRQQRGARTHLPHGRRESNLGLTAHSWRIENAGPRYFRANRTALDAKSSQKSRSGKAMGGLSKQSSGSHSRDGLFHRSYAHIRPALLLLRHCTRPAAHSSLQRHQASEQCLGRPAAPRGFSV